MKDKQSIPGTYVPENFRMSKWLLQTELSLGAKGTYAVLASCSSGRDHVWPSQEYLAKSASVSVRTVQRYLKELVSFGLIHISRQYLMGQMRTVYSFLNHALVSFEPKKSKETAQSGRKKTTQPAQNQATKRADFQATKGAKNNDNFDKPYIKEEGLINNNNIPPTPRNEISLNSAELISAEADGSSMGGEDLTLKFRKEASLDSAELVPTDADGSFSGATAFYPELQKLVSADADGNFSGATAFNPELRKEGKAWTEAVKILAQKLSEYELNCWIQPLLFEKGEASVGILRLPNDFFRNHVEKNYGAEITKAFKLAGVSEVNFELMTTSQQQELEQMRLFREKARLDEEKKAIKTRKEGNQAPPADLEALPLESQFDLLYAAYPVQKEREKAYKIFMQLAKKNKLPPISDMFKSIKEHQAKDRWWREKMPPLLCNWLTSRKWLDKPYG